jgi:hypothetical protein
MVLFPHLMLFAVTASACLPSFATEIVRQEKDVSDYSAVCSYVLGEESYVKGIIEASRVTGRDRLLSNVDDHARVYRFNNGGLNVDYVVTGDDRLLIRSLRMTEEMLRRRVSSEKWLADRLHVELPFPKNLSLGCDLYQLQLSGAHGKLHSLTISALID